jgi:hypothetical protein
MKITAKFNSTCPVCTSPITKGEKVAWEPRSKATHLACSEYAEKDVHGFRWFEHDQRNQAHLEACASCQCDRAEIDCARREQAHDEAEYQRGIADVENWRENRRMFGDEVAERMEIEREMREGWDY